MAKNRITSAAFELPCPACILERPLLLRTEVGPAGLKPRTLEGSWAVCQQGFHALNDTAEDVIRRLRT